MHPAALVHEYAPRLDRPQRTQGNIMFISFNKHFWQIVWRIRSVIAFMIMLIIICAILIAFIEQLPLGDALYFSFITGLTIGYGDIVATTTAGRLISILLGVTGVLFSGLMVAAAVFATQRAVHEIHGDE